MSSTKHLRRFFNHFIIPTSLAIKDKMAQNPNRDLLGAKTSSDSLYQIGPFGPDFIETRSEDFAKRLERMWSDDDLPELIHLAKPVVKLAAVLYKKERGQAKVVSETLYELY